MRTSSAPKNSLKNPMEMRILSVETGTIQSSSFSPASASPLVSATSGGSPTSATGMGAGPSSSPTWSLSLSWAFLSFSSKWVTVNTAVRGPSGFGRFVHFFRYSDPYVLTFLFIVSFQGIGYGMCCLSLFLGTYYNIILSWAFFYIFSSFSFKLPWADCGNWWNTEGYTSSYFHSSLYKCK